MGQPIKCHRYRLSGRQGATCTGQRKILRRFRGTEDQFRTTQSSISSIYVILHAAHRKQPRKYRTNSSREEGVVQPHVYMLHINIGHVRRGRINEFVQGLFPFSCMQSPWYGWAQESLTLETLTLKLPLTTDGPHDSQRSKAQLNSPSPNL